MGKNIPKATNSSAGASPANTPGHGRFQAVAYNHLAYCVPDYAKVRDFWVKVLGMEDVWDDGVQCAVQCGDPPNQIYIRPIKPAQEKQLGFQQPRGDWASNMGRGFVDHYCFSIANYNHEEVRDELERRGLDPKGDGPAAWTVKDPSGWILHISDLTGLWPGGALPGFQLSAGRKNLASCPKPPASAFKAVAVSQCLRMVPNVEECRDFYMDLLGMDLLYDKPGDVPSCSLTFGPNNGNGLSFQKSPNGLTHVDHFSIAVSDYNQADVKDRLIGMGYDPKPAGKHAWSIEDPEGMRTEVVGVGHAELMAGAANSR